MKVFGSLSKKQIPAFKKEIYVYLRVNLMSDTLYKTAKATVPKITEAKERTRFFISKNAILSAICIMVFIAYVL